MRNETCITFVWIQTDLLVLSIVLGHNTARCCSLKSLIDVLVGFVCSSQLPYHLQFAWHMIYTLMCHWVEVPSSRGIFLDWLRVARTQSPLGSSRLSQKWLSSHLYELTRHIDPRVKNSWFQFSLTFIDIPAVCLIQCNSGVLLLAVIVAISEDNHVGRCSVSFSCKLLYILLFGITLHANWC